MLDMQTVTVPSYVIEVLELALHTCGRDPRRSMPERDKELIRLHVGEPNYVLCL